MVKHLFTSVFQTSLLSSLCLFTLSMTAANSFADPHPEKIIQDPHSACSVKDEAGEYSNMSVVKNGHSIFQVKGDSVYPVFSPSGKYIAFSGSDMDTIALEGSSYLLVVYNCDKGVAKGYVKIDRKQKLKPGVSGYPYLRELKWTKDENHLKGSRCWEVNDLKTHREKLHCTLFATQFNDGNPLP